MVGEADEDKLEKILENLQVINTPVVSNGKQSTLGYQPDVKEFLAEYRASKAEYSDYQSAVAMWEQQTGNKAESDSFRARLQQKQMEVKERENNRQSHYYRNDRGGR